MIVYLLFFIGGGILVLSVIASLYFLFRLPTKEYEKIEKKIILLGLFGFVLMALAPVLILIL